MGLKKYIISFFLMAALVFVFPMPTVFINVFSKSTALKILKSDDSVIMFGSSTVDTVSKCNSDKRTIPEMITDKTGGRILDASYGGAVLEWNVNLAAAAAKKTNIQTEIFSFGMKDLIDHDNLSFHDYLLLRLINPALDVDGPVTYFGGLPTMQPAPPKEFNPFTYLGVSYGGLAEFNASVFPKERDAETCPEKDGQDLNRVAAIYFHEMIEYPPNLENVRLLASLNHYVESLHKTVIFVMLPTNFEILGRFNPSWPDILRSRRDTFIARMKDNGVSVLDLSEGLPNQAFLGRWCGCSHLTAVGRDHVARGIAEAFVSASSVSQHLPVKTD